MSQKQLNLNPLWQTKFSGAQAFNEIMNLSGDIFRDTSARKTLRVALDKQEFFIKKHFGVGLKEILKNYLFLRRPIVDMHTEKNALEVLAQANVKVPSVIASGVECALPHKRKSFIVLEAMQHEHSLEDIALNKKDFFLSVKKRRYWIKLIASIVRRMHQAGVNHRDLYLCHFLVLDDSDFPSADQVCVIDLHRAQIWKKIPKRWLIKDLAGLYFSTWPLRLSTRDKLCFMKAYRDGALRETLNTEKYLWDAVQIRAEKIYQKFQRKYPEHDYRPL